MTSIELCDKHPSFNVLTDEPFNGSPPPEFLVQDFVTPADSFFVRNHGGVPAVEPTTLRLMVDGMVRHPLSLALDELRERFPRVDVMATLQCAGNRRQELLAHGPIDDEVPWGVGAISNGLWSGVRLRDVLIAAGIDRRAHHVAFAGLDEVVRDGEQVGYGGSIPLEKALMPEVVLAFELNGEPLQPVHGYPLRVIVPGYIGARSVKWLSRITLQMEPSANYFQQRAYRLFPPDITPETVDWNRGIMMGPNSLNTVICYPSTNDQLPAGPLSVLGYAVGDGIHSVRRVDVSADGGQHWTAATFLTDHHDPFIWQLWQADLDLRPGDNEIIARATDSAGNTQPRDTQEIWNFKGYGNNAWHRVAVTGLPAE